MGNKVDIRKLIKKKYSENTLELPDLLEEIDLVLNEAYDYARKHDTTDILPISEDPKQSIRIANAVNGNSVPLEPEIGAPRNARPNSDQERWLHADKIAEADEPSSGGKNITVPMPDLFSMITNSQMEPGDEDRKTIQSIVLNMKDTVAGEGNWIKRIESISKYMEGAAQPEMKEARDIRRAVSNLIFLNLLKKISFFVAQPGKLFEYIITPLIGTEAKVLGTTDQQITDVTKESQGRTWSYSIKIFTGKTSDYVLGGSRVNLIKDVSNSERPITYIIAVAREEKRNIEFTELSVSSLPQHFPISEWKFITQNTDCILLKNQQTNFLGVLVKKMPDEYYLSLEQKKDSNQTLTPLEQQDINDFVIYSQYTGLQKPEEKPTLKPEIPKAIQDKKEDLKKHEEVKTLMDSSKNLVRDYLKQDIEPVSTANVSADTNKIKFRQAFGRAQQFIKKYLPNDKRQQYETLLNTNIQDLTYPKTTPDNSKLEKVVQIQNLFRDLYNEMKKQVGTVTGSITKENLSKHAILQEAKPLNRDKPPQFKIGLKTQWTSLSQIVLNLGDPKVYNQYQLQIASNLAEDTEKVLNAYKDLNTNLVKFFATSKEDIGAEPGKEPRAKGQIAQANTQTGFGDAVIKNATDIEEGVRGFLEKEGTPSQIKK
jgi:hypothetical protein